MTSDAVLDTLEALIAPGKRSHLSPFAESAQFKVLFGEAPDVRRRAESSQHILANNAERIEQLARHWDNFAREGKNFAENDYGSRDFLDAYLVYYFSVNVPKVQLVMLDFVREARVRGDVKLVDLGVGTGSTAVGVLDFLLVWAQACRLHGEPFPVTSLQLVGVDSSDASLEQAKRVVSAYGDSLLQRLGGTGPVEDQTTPVGGGRDEEDTVRRVYEWARAAAWSRQDLADGVPSIEFDANLVIASNVWSELSDAGHANFDGYLASLSESALVAVIEPGSRNNAGNLMSWRRALLRAQPDFASVGPCGQEFGNNLPSSCGGCWNSRRESFHQPSLYQAFRAGSANLAGDSPHFDEYENHLLSWTYVMLERGRSAEGPQAVPKSSPLTDGEVAVGPLRLRFIGSYRGQDPTSYDPDEFRASRTAGSWSEFLKACPAPYGASGLILKRLVKYPALES